MDRNEIMKMARAAGIENWWDKANADQLSYEAALKRFAALVSAAERAESSIPDDVWRDATRYRFVRVADGVRISHEAARDPAAYDEAIDRAMRERGCGGLPKPKGIGSDPTQAVLAAGAASPEGVGLSRRIEDTQAVTFAARYMCARLIRGREAAVPESLLTEAMTQAFARVFDVHDQAGTFGPALRAALAAAGRAPMQQDSDLDSGPTPGDLLAWGSQAVLDVAAERRRQLEAEGWTPEHDDQHSAGQLAGAAACYARHVNSRGWVIDTPFDNYTTDSAPIEWPWDDSWWKPTTPRRDLVKAGALILAEIERLDRLVAKKQEGG